MSKLYNLSHSARHINRLPHEQEAIHTQLVTDAAAQIFQKEWHRLTQCDALRMSLSSFTAGFVSSFSFADIYENIQNCAPKLLSLIESFNLDPAPGVVGAPETTISRRRRLAVTSITTLLSGRSLSTVQSIITYYLYASRVPKRVFTILNNLGISSSYRTLIRIIEQQADSDQPGGEAKDRLDFQDRYRVQLASPTNDQRVEWKFSLWHPVTPQRASAR